VKLVHLVGFYYKENSSTTYKVFLFKYLCNITFTRQYFLDVSMFKILMPAHFALFSHHETAAAV
jgi:hypothetical protein